MPETPPDTATPAEAAPAPPAIKLEASFEDFLKLDLRVATIREAAEHPDADRLLVLQVDAGEGQTRQICAGIRGRFEPAALVGRQIVIVANLAPRKIRGQMSNGMLLAGGDGDDLRLAGFDGDLPPGTTVG
ncbi:tRNA-binding protein [Phycisphaera mikurensis]|uniref:Methionine--tRNA ligase n=1 Tax=Phycisphaera mikurensis (strain NBRC 102666 / KCTC 22515 / FYK2301M01) TaxID=1142394 RepID=I0IGB1_PHYMF|nr:tRNA-binding protein [Phycisphaera mikurensis]MBB6440321.1 methionyl-tRNA synthetase [Phycisphaera mikurensis]BAM04299.1 tRNA binding protein [Phycisphaera mikurensis NBRC 102666]